MITGSAVVTTRLSSVTMNIGMLTAASTAANGAARLVGGSASSVIVPPSCYQLITSKVGTKQRLFIAGFEQAADRIERAFREADATDLQALGAAYSEMLEQRELLGMLMHGFAASSDEEIGKVVRARFGGIYTLIRELTGADEREATDFLATGMLLTVLASIRVIGPDAVPVEPWMAGLADSLPEDCG